MSRGAAAPLRSPTRERVAVIGAELISSRSTLNCLRPRSVVVCRRADLVSGAALDVNDEFVPEDAELSEDGDIFDEVRDEVGDDNDTGDILEAV